MPSGRPELVRCQRPSVNHSCQAAVRYSCAANGHPQIIHATRPSATRALPMSVRYACVANGHPLGPYVRFQNVHVCSQPPLRTQAVNSLGIAATTSTVGCGIEGGLHASYRHGTLGLQNYRRWFCFHSMAFWRARSAFSRSSTRTRRALDEADRWELWLGFDGCAIYATCATVAPSGSTSGRAHRG